MVDPAGARKDNETLDHQMSRRFSGLSGWCANLVLTRSCEHTVSGVRALTEGTSPFLLAAALDRATGTATLSWAAGLARWRAQHDGWNGETERLLAVEALHDDAAFKRAASRAARIVAEHWGEISSEP